jgi:hypothetical protein
MKITINRLRFYGHSVSLVPYLFLTLDLYSFGQRLKFSIGFLFFNYTLEIAKNNWRGK